jgi:hypothetical protein
MFAHILSPLDYVVDLCPALKLVLFIVISVDFDTKELAIKQLFHTNLMFTISVVGQVHTTAYIFKVVSSC